MPFLTLLCHRLRVSFLQRPSAAHLRNGVLCLSIHALASLSFALVTRFLAVESPPELPKSLRVLFASFFAPGLSEELVFRVLLLPHRQVDGLGPFRPLPRLFYGALSVGLFVIYHLSPFHKPKKVFSDLRFLTLAGILGTSCAFVYLDSGSIWLPTVIHYLTVIIWSLFLGGYNNLHLS